MILDHFGHFTNKKNLFFTTPFCFTKNFTESTINLLVRHVPSLVRLRDILEQFLRVGAGQRLLWGRIVAATMEVAKAAANGR